MEKTPLDEIYDKAFVFITNKMKNSHKNEIENYDTYKEKELKGDLMYLAGQKMGEIKNKIENIISNKTPVGDVTPNDHSIEINKLQERLNEYERIQTGLDKNMDDYMKDFFVNYKGIIDIENGKLKYIPIENVNLETPIEYKLLVKLSSILKYNEEKFENYKEQRKIIETYIDIKNKLNVN